MPVNHDMPSRWRGELDSAAPAPDDVREDILAEYAPAGGATELNRKKTSPAATGERGVTSEHPWRLVACWVPSKTSPGAQACFEIYRASEVSLTSTLRSGGDWRWRLRAEPDRILASGRGYRTEQECTHAVEQLKHYATGADIRQIAAPGLKAPGAI